MSQGQLILAINAGSSSLKISLFSLQSHESHASSSKSPVNLILTSSLDGISSPPATFSFSFSDPSKSDKAIKKETVEDVKDHASAFSHFLERLEKDGGIKQDDIKNVCHRVVHGGDYEKPVIVSQEAYHHIEALTDLAPL
jgi:acetate kinase